MRINTSERSKMSFPELQRTSRVEIKAVVILTSNALKYKWHTVLSDTKFRCLSLWMPDGGSTFKQPDKRLLFLLLWPNLIRYHRHPIPYSNRGFQGRLGLPATHQNPRQMEKSLVLFLIQLSSSSLKKSSKVKKKTFLFLAFLQVIVA